MQGDPPGRFTADACAVAFYAGLADGRWDLEAPLYQFFYAGAARGWLAPLAARPDVRRLLDQDLALAALTQAAQRAFEAWRAAGAPDAAGHAVLTDAAPPLAVAWQRTGGGDALVMALGPHAADVLLWRPIIDRFAQGYRISIVANRAAVVSSSDAGEAAAAPGAGPDAATSTVEDRGVVWRVTARPDPSRGPDCGTGLRRGVYLGTLGLMLTSVALAGYFAIRTMRKELEVARLEVAVHLGGVARIPVAAVGHLAPVRIARHGARERRGAHTRVPTGSFAARAARLRRLVDNLLDFARIEEGRQQYRFDAVDVAAWLTTTHRRVPRHPGGVGTRDHVTMAEALPAVESRRRRAGPCARSTCSTTR